MTFSLAEFHSPGRRVPTSDCDFRLECEGPFIRSTTVGFAGVMFFCFDESQASSLNGFKTDFEGWWFTPPLTEDDLLGMALGLWKSIL